MTSRQKKVWAISVWVVLHAILLSIGLWTPWKVDSNLYSVLPDAAEFKNVSEAENALSARSARNLTVLLGHESFGEAKAAAESLDSAFVSDSAFAETRLKVDESTMQQMRDFFFEYRYVLQGHDVRALLKNDDAAAIRELALQKVYGAFSLADLTRLQEDPFLLGAESFDYFTFHSPMMAGHFSLRDGVLAAEDSSFVYVMWSAALAEGTSSMASDGHVLQRFDRVLDSLQGVHKGLRVEKSGVPFHSYESSKNAQSEVAWISGVSVVAILLLLLWVFRSPLPIVCTLASIGVAVCAALSGTWAIFGSIHGTVQHFQGIAARLHDDGTELCGAYVCPVPVAPPDGRIFHYRACEFLRDDNAPFPELAAARPPGFTPDKASGEVPCGVRIA